MYHQSARPAHVMIVSDDGASTLFDKDERGNSGWDVATRALQAAGGGGTMVLNLPREWEKHARRSTHERARGGYSFDEAYYWLLRAREEQGWLIREVASWEDLVAFAREFSRRHYGRPTGPSRDELPRASGQ